MREFARIQFRGDTAAFEAAWNSRYAPPIELGIATLYKDQPEYQHMRQLFNAFAPDHEMTWHERVDAEYSDGELASFELLRLNIIGRAGAGDNAHATVYVEEPECSGCGRVAYRQVRSLVLDFSQVDVDPCEIGYFQHDLCETDFDEFVVSTRVKALLEEQQVRGVALRPVTPALTGRPAAGVTLPYYQLLVEPQIGPLVEPSPVERLDRCEVCGRYRQVLLGASGRTRESEFYFPRSSYAGDCIMRTTDPFGRLPRFGSKLIINQRMYRLLRENRITGYWVQPAHLVD